MINEISGKINTLRKNKKMTLKDLSEASGLSISFLSQIENGSSSLAITSLKKIADALNVPITYFFESRENCNYHLTLANQKKWQMEGSPLEYIRLCSDFPETVLEPMLVTIPPKSNLGQKYSHLGEEFIFVLEGTLVVDLEETRYHVIAGESIHYPSTIKHYWSNPSNEEVRVLSVTTPPIFK